MKEEFTFIQIITTGPNPILDRICYISLSVFNKSLNHRETYSTWINPEKKISENFEKFLGITNQELKASPKFSEISSQVMRMIKNKKLGVFSSETKILDFIKEELFNIGIDFNYKNSDLILVKDIEEALQGKNIEHMYFKYYDTKLPENFDYTKVIGEVFKQQCILLNKDFDKFDIKEVITRDFYNISESYVYEKDNKLFFNFGRHKDKDVATVNKNYIEWVLYNEFPLKIKKLIVDYLNDEQFNIDRFKNY